MLKYNKILLCIILLKGSIAVYAQQENLFFYYDSLTYSQYENKQWNNLTRSTGEAIRKDFDYYYMRMRAGIARYERGNYLMAEKHFNKAAKLNKLDPVSREYIYYSKLFSGKDKEASLYFKRNLDYLKDKVKSENKIVRNLLVDVAYHFNFENDLNSLFDAVNLPGITGNQIITKNFIFGSFLLSHDITRFLTLTHGGSLLRKNNFIYTISPEINISSYDHKINQYQYYASLGIHPGSGFNLNGSVHYVNFVSPEIIYRQRGFGTNYSIPGIKEHYLLSRVSLYKYIQLFRFGTGMSFSNLNNRNQFQKDANLIFFPLGNRSLYTISDFYHVTETGGNETENYLSFHQGAGMKLAKRLWLETGFWSGEMKNFATNEAFVIYNGNETITSRYDLSLIIPDENISVSFNGSFLNYYSTFMDSNSMDTSLNKMKFNGITLVAEIKWIF